MANLNVVGLVCLGLLGGCELGQPKLERRELPGLSIELPVGAQFKTVREQIDYKLGEISVSGTLAFGTVMAMVRWNPGEKLTAPELEVLAPALGATKDFKAAAVPGTIAKDGTLIETLRITTPSGPMMLSQLACGGRNVLVMSMADRGGNELHARIVNSVVCHPDPVKEKTLAVTQVPLKLDLPGWFATSRENNQLMLSDGASFLMLQPMPASTKQDMLVGAAPMLDAMFKGTIKAGAASGNRVALGGSFEGEKLEGYMRITNCANAAVLSLGLSGDKTHADALDAKLAAATCVPPGQPLPSWPDAPKQ